MASLITKKKRGREYLYWVRSARVDGKPRIVEQVYLGPKDRVLAEIKQGYSSGNLPGPCPLREIHNREFGASALLWQVAENLNLVEIIDRHVPPPPDRRRTHLSVGHYLLLATINRAVQASSKRALYEDWYRHSVVSRSYIPHIVGEISSELTGLRSDGPEDALGYGEETEDSAL